MNNSLFNLFSRKDKKRFKYIVEVIESGNVFELMSMDNDNKFGFNNQKYLDQVIDKINQEIQKKPKILLDIMSYSYNRTDFFVKYALKENPEIVKMFIDEKLSYITHYIIYALNNGFYPDDNYINAHLNYFCVFDIMKILFDRGYRPSNETVERYYLVFSHDELLDKLLDSGYVPSLEFIKKTNLLKNPKYAERVFNYIDLTPEIIKDSIFVGNAWAQQKVIEKNPELLLSLDSTSEVFTQYWIEAFKIGYIPDEIKDNYYVMRDPILLTKVIRQRPEFVKYCKIYEDDVREQLDKLALCMGYVPTIMDIKDSEYLRKSSTLMESVIHNRPEAVKYLEIIGPNGIHPAEQYRKSYADFTNLCQLALDNGYIPTERDIIEHPTLVNNYEIMKILIQENPNLINMINEYTPRKEELLQIALKNGFKGEIKINSENRSNFIYSEPESLLSSETAIMYDLKNGHNLRDDIPYGHNYSINLYNYFIDKGYVIEDIIDMFTENIEVMKLIISKNPEYVTKISNMLPRKAIDELCLLAIDGGYEPKVDDEIFGYGTEAAKIMVRKHPDYLPKVKLLDPFGFLSAKTCEGYDEICKISVDGGFLPDVEEMGNGYGGMTTTRYNYSYDIMKKAIALKPSLIESCMVTDKEKYDELCRIAIDHGYEISSEYALTHWGVKMLSNYDLMAKYLKENPIFISKVDVTDPDEMLKLINIAIDAGLKISDLGTRSLLKIFLPIDEARWPDYLSNEQIDSLTKAKSLYTNNDEISETVLSSFIKDEEITSHFTKVQIEILSCYPELQKKIVSIKSNGEKINLVYEIAYKYKDNLEWIPILEKVLDNITSPEFANLLESTKNKELTDEDKDELLYLLITDNHLCISSEQELKNIDSIRENYINRLINRNTLGSLKTAYFEKVFSIDLTTAIYFVNTYGKSLEGRNIESLDEDYKMLFTILNNMKTIINLNNINILKYYINNVNPDFVVKPDLMITFEAKLKYMFTEEFNKSFTKPNEEDKFITDIEEEQDYDIYLAAGHDGNKKCRMMITSIGAYTNMEEPDDYYASWNVEKIASHGCCCSYVGEKNLGTAEVKYCCLGFTDYDLGTLQLAGPYDLCSASEKDSYKIYSMFSSMFMLPDDILNQTRHTHNEIVWERRNISGDKMFKKQPSYIVYFVDNFDDRLSDPEAMKQWESVKKASKNFSIVVDGVKKPLPIMVVEREKIAKSQIEIIHSKLDEFEKTLNPKLIFEIISDYESNYAGNREYHPNISLKYFPKFDKLSDSVVGKILVIIKNISKSDSKKAIECINELEKVVKSEQEKYNNTQHGVSQSKPSFNIEETLIEINNLKSSLRMRNDSTLVVAAKSKDNLRQFYKSDKPKLSQDIISSQLSVDDVMKLLNDTELNADFILYENEIKEEKVNGKLKVHGQRHVTNVLLYSILIGQSVFKDKHDLLLIMKAAKYHDVGRKTDAYEEHAKASAEIAKEKLMSTTSAEDIAIIITIIEFHEMPRHTQYAEDEFIKIARKNGVPSNKISVARKMADVLMDADALDRTRFINKARLKPEYLHYDISKQLVEFASSLQETYAKEDLKEFECDEALNVILEKFTPQEVLRVIRHSMRGKLNSEDVLAFIHTWASTIHKKEDELDEMFDESNPTMKEGVKNDKK